MRTRAALAVLTIAAAAHAQERDQSLGPWLDGHYTHASGTTIDGETRNGVFHTAATGSSAGGGLSIGYGFTPWLSIYGALDGDGTQQITGSSGPTIQGSLALTQIDAGLRLQLPIRKIRLTPYGLLAYSSRELSGHAQGYSGAVTSGTLAFWGSAWTYGLGLEFFFARAFSIDASWQRTSGVYERIQIPTTAVFSTNAGTSTASRVLAGVTWHAGPQGPVAKPVQSADPLEIGQTVHVHAGTRTVSGTIAYLGRDTLIVQQLVNDVPAQTAVPVACITGVDRRREVRPIGPALINGGVIGGIGGMLAAAIANGSSGSKPRSASSTAAAYFLGGAVIGAGVATIYNLTGDRFQPAPRLPRPDISQADLAALCAPWNPLP